MKTTILSVMAIVFLSLNSFGQSKPTEKQVKKEVKKERKIDLQLRRKPRGQHHSRPGSNQRTTRR